MPLGTATVTAKTGPNVSNTAIALANVSSVTYDNNRMMLFVTQQNPARTVEYDLTGVTTATITITSGNFVFAVS